MDNPPDIVQRMRQHQYLNQTRHMADTTGLSRGARKTARLVIYRSTDTPRRVVAISLVPLTVAPFVGQSMHPVLDSVLCAMLVAHSHVGFQYVQASSTRWTSFDEQYNTTLETNPALDLASLITSPRSVCQKQEHHLSGHFALRHY